MPANELQGETMKRRPQGFAVLSPDEHRLIASKGGRTAHANGHAHRFTSEQARLAGAKGAAIRHSKTPIPEASSPKVLSLPVRPMDSGFSIFHQMELERLNAKHRRFLSAIRSGGKA